MRITKDIATVLALLALLGTSGDAQFWDMMTNPKVATTIAHPPGLGIQVNKVAFGPVSGEGAAEFVDGLSSRFVHSGVEVIERTKLDALLREQNFSLSGYVDRDAAVQMGKILGPSVMIFATMQRHATEQKKLYQDWKDGKGIVHRTYISRTQAFVRGSVRSVDLATSRVFAQKTVEATPVAENKANDQCCPEFPGEFDLLDRAMEDVVGQAARLYLPWTEVVELYYFDDKDCGLKNAFARHKLGDVEGALQQSMSNLETCKALPKPNPKVLAHAYHNVGMGYFAKGDHEQALSYLNEAQRVKPGQIYAEAIAECRRADALAREMLRVEERAEVAAAAAEQKVQASAAAAAAQVLTNNDITALAAAKLPPAVLITKIKSAPCQFDTSTNALIQLSQAGVPPEVITAMMDCGRK